MICKLLLWKLIITITDLRTRSQYIFIFIHESSMYKIRGCPVLTTTGIKLRQRKSSVVNIANTGSVVYNNLGYKIKVLPYTVAVK